MRIRNTVKNPAPKPVCRIQCFADPDPELFDSWIQDPGMVYSRSRISESFIAIGFGIQDLGLKENQESGIPVNIPAPQHGSGSN
jgi:hypothetical protein